jgi:uncharacterized protein
MALQLSSASLPVFTQFLENLRHILIKAQAHVQSSGFDEQALVQYRLYPDMLPFKTQICIACDAPKLCVARISGKEAPKYENTENTLSELIQRVNSTLNWIQGISASDLDGKDHTDITFPVGKTATKTLSAEDYLKTWALPNMFFHITTAYVILRHNGVPLGKADYLMGANA